jgi:hypothetical protein
LAVKRGHGERRLPVEAAERQTARRDGLTDLCTLYTEICTHITLDIDAHVQLAAREGKTLTRVIQEALRERAVAPFDTTARADHLAG